MNDKQSALAAEIRAEMAARRITATEMQAHTGIKHASWRNWFVTCIRPVPYPVLEAVSDALGIPLSELLHRAEVRAATTDSVATLEGMLSPSGRAAVERGRAAVRGRKDPQVSTWERSRRSA